MVEAAPRQPAAALAGVRVLVTRPRHQSDALAASIEAHGGRAIRLPVIDILPVANPAAARAQMHELGECALAVFTSANAVRHALELIDEIPRRARVAAVGARSAALLEQSGFEQVLCPSSGASSEALLALDALAAGRIEGKRVLIVRGEGGRELLGRTLEARGAQVRHAVVYRRAFPQVDTAPVAEQGRAGAIDAIVATSVEGLDNLFRLMGQSEAHWLREARYVVLSERIAARVRAIGVHAPPVIVERADDEGIVDALIRWRSAGDGGGG